MFRFVQHKGGFEAEQGKNISNTKLKEGERGRRRRTGYST